MLFNVKLFVILVLLDVGANGSEYCKICRNHTLCKYPVPGPSRNCEGYDATALLTRDDIITLVNRINERRNFVALGLSKRLPTAANMRKISWSEDLAWSAQRWVDQCDQTVRPDKHDLCRNLEDKAVGQSMATIFGPTQRLSVKSFVDIWFMQTLDYSGKVSFYNETQDTKTKYFTQLIWAETDSVGCGKARFRIEYSVEIERLVCNFAPSGNLHGKPVYAIGVPATQCPEGCIPDDTYTGLCSYRTLNNIHRFKSSTVASLLQILNLANSSLKQEIDPLKNNLNQSNVDVDENNEHRHHKSRHVVNNSQVLIPHFLQHRPTQRNNTRDFLMPQYQPNRAQPMVYHGYNHKGNVVPPYTATTEIDFRRFDLMTPPNSPSTELHISANYRKFNQHNQCTRRSQVIANCNSPVPCITDKCTRGQNHGCAVTLPCVTNVQTPHVYPHNLCPCSSPTTCPPTPRQSFCCETTCNCPCHVLTPEPCCHKPSQAEELGEKDARKTAEMHYYDHFPNLALRGGDMANENLPNKTNIPTERKHSFLRKFTHNTEKNKVFQHIRREHHITKSYGQVTHEFDLPNYMEKEGDYAYRIRQKRAPEDRISTKPFWKINEYENQHPIIMKSLHYTTLRSKKKNNWRIAHHSVNSVTATEPITIELKSRETNDKFTDYVHGTEKYLSFDELLHLRKSHPGKFSARRNDGLKPVTSVSADTISTNYTKFSARRSDGNATTTTETPPANYTTNTPYKRKKYCTRRLTCTWTAFTATASDGSIIQFDPGVGGGSGGSRTPPGYVEGCSRTSTCTREFMNRNKISTLPMTTLLGQETLEDEDYCERRSLDIQRPISNEELEQERIVKRHDLELYKTVTSPVAITLKPELLIETRNVCICTKENTRLKRNAISNNMLRYKDCIHKNKEQYKNPMMSYGDLYYLIINKLMRAQDKEKKGRNCSKCACSGGAGLLSRRFLIVILILMYIGI